MEPAEQALSTPPVRKRRRRRLIVAFVLVLVSLVTWWYWPRGDARFVGKWELEKWFSQRSASTFQFLANGRGRFCDQPSAYSTDEPSERAFRWWVAGDALYLEWHDDRGFAGLFQRLHSVVAPHLGATPLLRPELRRIYEVQPDKIVVDSMGLGGWESRTVLTRTLE